MKLKDLSEKPQWICLFAGKSGSGKSGAAASFAEQGPIEIMDVNMRARGILGCQYLSHLFDKINIWRPNFKSKDLYDDIAKRIENHKAKSLNGKLEFDTLILEEVTVLIDLMLRSSIRLRGGETTGHKIRGRHEFNTPDDHNYAASIMREMFYEYLLPLRCNIIVTAWIVDEYAPDPASPYLPQIVSGQKLNTTPKQSQSIPGMFDEVWLFEKEELPGKKIRHKVYFQSALAKTSIPALAAKGSLDITGKNFYNEVQSLLKETK